VTPALSQSPAQGEGRGCCGVPCGQGGEGAGESRGRRSLKARGLWGTLGDAHLTPERREEGEEQHAAGHPALPAADSCLEGHPKECFWTC